MLSKSTFFFVATIFAVIQSVYGVIVNNEVSQIIDASTSIVKYVIEIKAAGIDGQYDLIFPNTLSDQLSYLSVKSKGKPLTVQPPVSNADYTTFVVQVPENSATLKVQAVFTNILEPYPAEITQSENQLVRLKGNHYFYSPYKTVSQKTVVKLASSTIESYSKLSPVSPRGSAIHYGPYQDVAPFEISPMAVHYVNNFPFAKFSTLTKEIEVSHWGSIAIEEIYELKHAGAALKGGFSRFDYQMKRAGLSQTPSFRNLVGYLPIQANNIYYRDQIGNISTSDIRVSKDKSSMELDVQTRFPIFGGWQTQFYIGYSIPTELALSIQEDGTYQLKFDFFTIFKNVWIEDLEIKVILPETCSNIKVNVPYTAEESRTIRYTYLDSQANGGRPVIILKAKNIVEEHDKQVVITYEFNKSKMIVEPLMLVACFFLFFILLTSFSRTKEIPSSASVTKEPSPATSEKKE